MNGHPYAFKLTIDIPDQPMTGLNPIAEDLLTRRGVKTTGTLTRTFEGIVTVPAGVTAEQVREHVVNEAAREHLGTTVTIVCWELVPAPEEPNR